MQKALTLFVILCFFMNSGFIAMGDLILTLGDQSGATGYFDGKQIITDGSFNISGVTATSTVGYDITFTILDGDLVFDYSKLTFFTGPSVFSGFAPPPYIGMPTEITIRMAGGAFMPIAVGTEMFSGLEVHGTQGTLQIDEIVDTGAPVVSTFQVVPEPATLALLGLGTLSLFRRR